jgi:peptidoglycan/LPS O-acetylase OafA/YrhL
MSLLNQFLHGAIMMTFLVAGLFFLRFHRRTRERLFAIFAGSFFVLAIERIVLASTDPTDEFRPYIYLIRLAAYLLIIVAIVDKNRAGKSGRVSASEHERDHIR